MNAQKFNVIGALHVLDEPKMIKCIKHDNKRTYNFKCNQLMKKQEVNVFAVR